MEKKLVHEARHAERDAADKAAKLTLEYRVEQLEARVAELLATHAGLEARLADFEKQAARQTEPKARKHTAAGKPAGGEGFTYEEALQQCGGEEEIKKASKQPCKGVSHFLALRVAS